MKEDGKKRRIRGRIADKIWDADKVVKISIDEVTAIKERVAKVSNNIVMNRVFDILGE